MPTLCQPSHAISLVAQHRALVKQLVLPPLVAAAAAASPQTRSFAAKVGAPFQCPLAAH